MNTGGGGNAPVRPRTGCRGPGGGPSVGLPGAVAALDLAGVAAAQATSA